MSSSASADDFPVTVVALLRSASVSRSSSVMPMMPFMGVRISWLMLARNSLLARLQSRRHPGRPPGRLQPSCAR